MINYEINKIADIDIEYKGAKRKLAFYRSIDNNIFIEFNNDGATTLTDLKTTFDGYVETSATVEKVYQMNISQDYPNTKEDSYIVFKVNELNLEFYLNYSREKTQFEGVREYLGMKMEYSINAEKLIS